MKLTYYGHSACLLETGGHRLLIDPFLSGNPLCETDPEELEPDYILLTHGHGDHVGDTEAIARRTGATVIANFEIATWLGAKGLTTHPMHIGGQASFPFGAVKLTIAHHGSTYVDESGTFIPLGNPAGLLIFADDQVFHHAGDTALTMDMKLLGERYDIDLAMLPIGDNFTMGIDDAATAAEFLQAKRVVPIHYNTFPYIEVDVNTFVERCSCPVDALDPGESLSF